MFRMDGDGVSTQFPLRCFIINKSLTIIDTSMKY